MFIYLVIHLFIRLFIYLTTHLFYSGYYQAGCTPLDYGSTLSEMVVGLEYTCKPVDSSLVLAALYGHIVDADL